MGRQTSIGIESIQKIASPPSTFDAILSRTWLHKADSELPAIIILTTGYERKKSSLYSFNLEKKSFHYLYLLIRQQGLNWSLLSQRTSGRLLCEVYSFSFTKSAENILHISRNLANIAYKLCIIELYINSLITIKILIINDMHNLFHLSFHLIVSSVINHVTRLMHSYS